MANGHDTPTPAPRTGGLREFPWLQLGLGVVALPALLGAATLLYVAIYGIEGRGNWFAFYAIANALFGFLFPRWWAIAYAGAFVYLYTAVRAAGQEGSVTYDYDRGEVAIEGAVAAAVGAGARLAWNRARRA